MATKRANEPVKKPSRAKGVLPRQLPLIHARRAVEKGLVGGYYLAMSRLQFVMAGLSLRTKLEKLNIELSTKVIQQIKEAFEEELRASGELFQHRRELAGEAFKAVEELIEIAPDLIDEIVKDAHEPALNRSGRKPLPQSLLTAVAQRKRKSRPLKRGGESV